MLWTCDSVKGQAITRGPGEPVAIHDSVLSACAKYRFACSGRRMIARPLPYRIVLRSVQVVVTLGPAGENVGERLLR